MVPKLGRKALFIIALHGRHPAEERVWADLWLAYGFVFSVYGQSAWEGRDARR